MACGISCHTFWFPPATYCRRRRGHQTWGLWGPPVEKMRVEGRWAFLFINQWHSREGLFWVIAIALSLVFRNPSFSLTLITQPAFFPFLQFFNSSEPSLVGRVVPTENLAWLFPSLYFCLFLLLYSLPGIMVVGPF